jgi:hypothetical protein
MVCFSLNVDEASVLQVERTVPPVEIEVSSVVKGT